jgi:uncharacterized protein with HEPN domain
LKDDRILLVHILKEISFLKKICRSRSAEDLLQDDYFSHAVIRAIEVIGEASKNVSQSLKATYPEVEWRQMAGMRDKVIHRYFEINWKIVWDVINTEIPVIEPKISAILQAIEGGTGNATRREE